MSVCLPFWPSQYDALVCLSRLHTCCLEYTYFKSWNLSSRLKQAKELRETLVTKLKIATESNLSAEERAARMDEMLEDEERRQKEIDQELKYLRDIQFRKMQELHETKTKERNHEAEIQVTQDY